MLCKTKHQESILKAGLQLKGSEIQQENNIALLKMKERCAMVLKWTIMSVVDIQAGKQL